MDLNKVQLIGNITQDVELKQIQTGQSVCSFTVATNRNWTDSSGIKQETVEFHNIVFWGKLAEISGQYLYKGRKVYVEGRLQTRSWEAQDGTKRYKTEIIGENLIILDSSKNSGTTMLSSDGINNNVLSDNGSNNLKESYGAIKKTSSKKEDDISVEDIPF